MPTCISGFMSPNSPPVAVKRKGLRVILWILLAYLVGSAAFAEYAVWTHRKNLRLTLENVGKETFRDTAGLRTFLQSGESELHDYDGILRFTPPFGWLAQRRTRHLEERVVFASESYALPETQRFSEPEKARQWGFDPEKKSDEAITDALMEALR